MRMAAWLNCLMIGRISSSLSGGRPPSLFFFSAVRPGACGRSFGRSAAVEGSRHRGFPRPQVVPWVRVGRDRKPAHPYDRRLRSAAGPSPAADSAGKSSHSTDAGCHRSLAPFSAGAAGSSAWRLASSVSEEPGTEGERS